MRDDVLGVLGQFNLRRITLMGHSVGGTVADLLAQEQPSRIHRLILEDTPPPFPRDRAVPTRPEGSLPFDWAAVPAIASQLNGPDPAWWDRLREITAPTLLIAGGPSSHIPQDKLRDVAAQIPACSIVTIPVGHHVHELAPTEFNAALTRFLRS